MNENHEYYYNITFLGADIESVVNETTSSHIYFCDVGSFFGIVGWDSQGLHYVPEVQKDGFGHLGIHRVQNPFVQLLYDYGVFVFELDRLLRDIESEVEEESISHVTINAIHDIIAGGDEYDVNYLIQLLDLLLHFLEEQQSKCIDERASDTLSEFVSKLETIVSK